MLSKLRLKKISALFLIAVLVLAFASCGASSEKKTESKTPNTEASESTEAETQSASESAEPEQVGKDILVVYFSATGTTKAVAQEIASVTDADVYEITAAQPYSEADLDWGDSDSRTTLEQNDSSVRPEISSEKLNLDSYKTIFIGFPIWWGEEPRIMDTFVESYDFTGKNVVPFCTSGGSGIGSSGDNLESNAGSGNWIEGERLSSSSDIEAWVSGLNL